MMLAQTDPGSVSPSRAIMTTITDLVQSFFALLPKFVLAIVVLALFVVAGRLVRARMRPRLERARTPSFAQVFSSLAYAGIVLLGLAIALPIAFESLSVASVLGGLGLLGIAAGFAFQDILSNLLAGILLIFRQPFVSGDQIEVDDIRGTVEGITIRETRIRTFDGRLVVVPNADVYTNAIEIQTDVDAIRSTFTTGVAYGTDLARARQVAFDTLAGIDGVLDDPAPQVYYVEHGASAIELELRYWTGSRQAEVRRVQDRVVEAIHDAFEDADIDIPFDIVTLDAGASFAEVMRSRGQG